MPHGAGRAVALTVVAACAAALASGCGGNGTESGKRTPRLRVEVVARGLEVPWAVAFLPGRGGILVAERPGRIRLVRGGRLVAAPVGELPVVAIGEAGLLGIALDPGYPQRPYLYVYATVDVDGARNRVSRFRLARAGPAGLRLGAERVVLDGIPAGEIHDGGRIAFGPDGMLYVTTGDSGRPDLAADRRSLAGKILRLTADGRVPDDNPFAGSPVWSWGHRNPQGIAWGPAGRLFAAEHGPTGDLGLCCHDEVNRIEPGAFYGWPFAAGGASTGAGPPPQVPRDPLAESGEQTWAPAGVAAWRGALYVATLRGERLLRFRLSGDGRRIEGRTTALSGEGRLREAIRGPDGCLYVTTSNRDGRGDVRAGDDRLLRLCGRR